MKEMESELEELTSVPRANEAPAARGTNSFEVETPGDVDAPCGWQRPRVLVVEDHADIREMLVEFLRESGFDVHESHCADAGLACLQHQRFDAVLTDYSLPGRSGMWMVSQAHAAGRIQREHVVLLTGCTRPEGAEGVRVLRKPYDLLSLRLELESVCDRRPPQ